MASDPHPPPLPRDCARAFELGRDAASNHARAAIELALDPETDPRVRSVLIVAGLDRAGVKPMDYDPAQDQPKPTWDPGALTDEEREQFKAMLRKMIGQT